MNVLHNLAYFLLYVLSNEIEIVFKKFNGKRACFKNNPFTRYWMDFF